MSEAGFDEVMRLINKSIGRVRRVEYGTPIEGYVELEDTSKHTCDECGCLFVARDGHVRYGHWSRCSNCWSDWQHDL